MALASPKGMDKNTLEVLRRLERKQVVICFKRDKGVVWYWRMGWSEGHVRVASLREWAKLWPQLVKLEIEVKEWPTRVKSEYE